MAAFNPRALDGGMGTVGHQIRQLRQRSQLTQTELARRIGIQQSDLSRMEKGEYRVPLNVLFRILGEFKVSLAEFFGEGEPAALTDSERLLIRQFRALDEGRRQAVVDFLAFQLDRQRAAEEKP